MAYSHQALTISSPEQVEELARIGCTNKEIMQVLDIDDMTLDRQFRDVLRSGRANLKQRLRKRQIEEAEKGNPMLLIWLGKQYLGQSNKMDLDLKDIPDEIWAQETKRRMEAAKKTLETPNIVLNKDE